MSLDATQQIDWLGMRLTVPHEWHIVRHAPGMTKGSLALVDRRQHRLLLTWAPCRKAPDWTRLFRDQRGLDLKADPDSQFIDLPGGDRWRGYIWVNARHAMLRAAILDRASERMVELALVQRDEDDANLAGAILDGFDLIEPGRFCAFDLEITPPPPEVSPKGPAEGPAGWSLRHVEATPGQVEVHYQDGGRQMMIRRSAMAGVWYGGHGEGYLKRQLKGQPGRFTTELFQGVSATRCESRVAGSVYRRLTQRQPYRCDLLWLDRATDALVQMTLHCPVGTEAPQREFRDWSVKSLLPHPPASLAAAPRRRHTVEDAANQSSRPRKPTPSEMLDTIPVQNHAVKRDVRDGATVLQVPLKRRWFTRGPARVLLPFKDQRNIGLDPVGQEVWDLCDGRRGVELIVEMFAARHRLRFHEARICVMQFMRELTRRGLLVMVMPPGRDLSSAPASGKAGRSSGQQQRRRRHVPVPLPGAGEAHA